MEDNDQLITLMCCHCKRGLATLFMNKIDDLCCLSIRCAICGGKSIDWKQSTKTADAERAAIWKKIQAMN